jgi:hypothetical protein
VRKGRGLGIAVVLVLASAGCEVRHTVGHFIDAGTRDGVGSPDSVVSADSAASPDSAVSPDSAASPETAAPVDVVRAPDTGPPDESPRDLADSSDGGHFGTVSPGQPLPSDDECAARVRRTAELRLGNAAYNTRRPTATELGQLLPWDDGMGFDNEAVALGKRVSGQFSGTTDEILQWGACKWGFDEDLVRAEVTELSAWYQDAIGEWTTNQNECPAGAATRQGSAGVECAQDYGLYQIMWKYTSDAWPMFREDTAFHVDFALGLRRVCFEGWATYLAHNAPRDKLYAAGDAWGCGGADHSGNWYNSAAQEYIKRIQTHAATRPWTAAGF